MASQLRHNAHHNNARPRFPLLAGLSQASRRRIRATTMVIVAAATAAHMVAVAPTAIADPRCPNNDPYYGRCVGGKILEEFNQAGGLNFFGNAVTNEADAARGGRWQAFQRNSSIYWHPRVSNGHANQIGGSIRDKWYDLGYENGSLRYPTTRELAGRKGDGRFNRFEGGNLYWSSATDAHPVWGQILQTWGSNDYEAGRYGYPATDESKCEDTVESDKTGAYGGFAQVFQNGELITYNTYSPTFKAPYKSAVVDGILFWQNQNSKYIDYINAAVRQWNQLGKVSIRETSTGQAMGVYDYYDDGDTNTAYYSANSRTISINDAKFKTPQDSAAYRVIIHEFGHALGLGHSCRDAIMDRYIYTNETIPYEIQPIDWSSYNAIYN